MSNEEFDRITPVNPPNVNKNTKPIDHSIGASNVGNPPTIVAIHLKIFTPVGIAITIVAAVK